MQSSKLTVKHQVTIPRDVRDALGLKAGDRVMFEVRDGKAFVTKYDREEMAEQWIVENREAVESWNAYTEAHGLPLAKYRQF